MPSKFLTLPFLLAAAYASPVDTVARDDCKPCSPSGAKGTDPPAVGSDLKSMYVDLLGSVKSINFSKREADSSLVDKRDGGLCCRTGSECVNVQGLNIPICYDKFTTNYIFSDGSYGSLTTGEYNAKDGSKVNLITGQYTKSGGESGDIYSGDAAAKPNTATLSIPPQWTASGVGSAIPVTELGSVVVYTTTISGTTITTPTTLSASTVFDGTKAITTIAPKTITAPTTIAPITSVITKTQNAAAASSSSSKGAAGHVSADSSVSFGMSIFTAFMCGIYAL
ncbi:hypothetical protein K469DRAFT_543357 [Zopfia rhizophila CBS 207.26]|uniref:Uncharacterized protein n=1 Tax=Zopfia rhizophila CBS 207.26 TaxID=1314779 RepID=A0A6A6EW67_9PEZI|nr:hypothetical protein K469DRAFT_543357 [Zopfia rhizophila CBS 207.26]